MLDIRRPIGLLFLALGVLLVAYGLTVHPQAQVSLGPNVDAVWGVVLAMFGAAMLAWRRLERTRAGAASDEATQRVPAAGEPAVPRA